MTNHKDPKDVHVTVKVTDLAAEKFQFESDDITVGAKNHLTFDNSKDHRGFIIYFELVGADGYRFPEDLDEALWVKAGSSSYCPQSKSSWGQFQAVEVLDAPGPDGKRRILKVFNKNDTEKNFAYTLRARNNSKWLTLDPGGTNNNGGEDPFMNMTTAIAVGVAAVALLTVAYIALR